MKRRTKRALAVVALTATLMSCSAPNMPTTTSITPAAVLSLHATPPTYPLLVELTTAYNRVQPDIFFSIERRDTIDMIDDSESTYIITNHLPSDAELWAAPIARDGIRVIAHPTLDVDSLTIAELRAIYQGRIVDWERVGGRPRPVTAFSHDSGSTLRMEFDRMVMGERTPSQNAILLNNSEQIAARVAATPGSIGYVAAGLVIDADVTTIALDGQRPTLENIQANTYPLRSTIYIIALDEPTGATRTFIGWVQSLEAQRIIARQYVPLIPLAGSQG